MPTNNPVRLLDTHIWLWFSLCNTSLSNTLIEKINHTLQEGSVFISAISLWELAMLEQKKRIILTTPCLEWINRNLQETHISVLPITPEIAVDSCQLPDSFHGDPADRMIIATARIEGIPLASKDNAILQYGKKYCIEVIG